jgi:hypothetical protein
MASGSGITDIVRAARIGHDHRAPDPVAKTGDRLSRGALVQHGDLHRADRSR